MYVMNVREALDDIYKEFEKTYEEAKKEGYNAGYNAVIGSTPKKFGQYINEKKKRMRGGYKRR